MEGRGFGMFPSFRFESRLPWGSGACLAGRKEIAEESWEAEETDENPDGEDVEVADDTEEEDVEGDSLFNCVKALSNRERIKLWRAAVQKCEDNVKKEEGIKEEGGDHGEDEEEEDSEEEEKELLGPSVEYVPQEEFVLESSFEAMSLPRALGKIGLPTVRGLESNQEGALLLANQVSGAIHHIEEMREANLKLVGRKKSAGRSFKTPEMVEKENEDAKWATAKVRVLSKCSKKHPDF